MLCCIFISGRGFMVEISLSVVLWGFGLKIPRFRLQAHKVVSLRGKKRQRWSLGSGED